jgi:hypothetical protein
MLTEADDLLGRALDFKRGVHQGAPFLTQVVVKPYQVVSNQPRGTDFMDVRAQRRFLDDLTMKFGELKFAYARATDIAHDPKCKSVQKRAATLEQRYSTAKREVAARGSDCLTDPKRKCHDRGLSFVEQTELDDLARSCKKSASPPNSRVGRGHKAVKPDPAGKPAGPTQRDTERISAKNPHCKLWRFTQVVTRVMAKKRSGEAWDGDDSAPDVVVYVTSGGRSIATFPNKAGYARTDAFGQPVYLDVGAQVSVRVVDSDLMADDPIGRPGGTVPSRLPGGAWVLSAGQATVTLNGQCVE